MNVISRFQKNISSYYSLLQEQYSAKYLKEVAIGLALLVVLGGGYFLNRLYVNNREEKAFVALSEVIESFAHSQQITQGMNPELDKEKIEQAWQDTQLLLEALHKEHMSSYLAPYFLVYKSQIVLEKDGNVKEAFKILDDALVQMSGKSEMKSLFQIKRIKMGLDIDTEHKRSLSDLIILSNDSSSVVFQEALYLLGLYYLHAGDIVKSQEAFKKLVSSDKGDFLIVSPWVKQAKEKIISTEFTEPTGDMDAQ